jgi:hypothetical protein
MTDLGHWFTLYIVSTILSYLAWQLSDIPKNIEKIRDNGNVLAIFLPFPIYFLEIGHYQPHGVGYVAYLQGYIEIAKAAGKIRLFFDWPPYLFFLFIIPNFRKSWMMSLIVSIIFIPKINFDLFMECFFALPADFGRDKVEIDEALHLKIFAERFNQCLDVFILLLILILQIEQPTEEETLVQD